ncbi:helix-turn-helix domain-containing protein, partial [Streptomyces sp. SID89]|nr:helix-turn-helix domain-containing protein [Streptomyces sp. SID89]
MAGEFGAVLRRLREKAGLTQDELERRSGVSVSTIRGLETGKRRNPRMTTVQQLADALALRSEDREELLGAAVPGRRGDGTGSEAEASAAEAGAPVGGTPGGG